MSRDRDEPPEVCPECGGEDSHYKGCELFADWLREERRREARAEAQWWRPGGTGANLLGIRHGEDEDPEEPPF